MSRTYEQLEPVISALDERIKTNLGAFPTDTAEGSIASFPDGADDIPLKSLVVNIDPVQSGSGDPSPDNVRPISGWTGMTVNASGKNLLNANADTTSSNGVTYTKNGDGTYTVNGTADGASSFVVGSIELTAGTQYVLSGCPADGSGSTYNVRVRDASYNALGYDIGSGTTITPAETKTFYYQITVASGTSVSNLVFKPMICLSTAPNPDYAHFTPYNGQTIPIDWQTEAGTVYGGHLDVLSGVLTVDRAMVDLGTLDWRVFVTDNIFGALYTQIKTTGYTNASKFPMICTKYATVRYYYGGIAMENRDKSIAYAPGGGSRIVIKDSAYSDGATLKTALSGVQLVYELATPITIQLTPHEVKSLYGQNNIFADTGDTEVEYRADTKLYIERPTEPDADMIADSNIVSGQYFMVGNNLYLATANIASGGQVIVGTNAIRKSLSEALNEINQ